MVRHEAEALPIERGAAAGAEMAPVPGVAVLGIDLECAAGAHHLGVGKIARPAEGAARSAIAAVAMADGVERGLAVDRDGAGLAAAARGAAFSHDALNPVSGRATSR